MRNGKSSSFLAYDLRCEYQTDPIGLDISNPRLSWKIKSDIINFNQIAYQIQVVSGSKEFTENVNIEWDSGKVLSSESVNLEYKGKVLRTATQYYWRVRLWDKHNIISAWSESGLWDTGLLDISDWQAEWVEPDQRDVQPEEKLAFMDLEAMNKPRNPEDYQKLNPCLFLRKEFCLKGGIRRARLYVTAHGVYKLFLNGKRVGDLEFAPEITAYHKYLMYQTYDITEMINSGKNVVGTILADGWWAGRIGITGDSCQYGNKLALIMQIEVEYNNGEIQRILTDKDFKSSTGPYE